MQESAKLTNFNDDVSVSLSEVRAVLDHWGLNDWQEYLLVRRPGKPNSYVVFANPKDTSDFQEQLIEFHKTQAEKDS